MLPDTPRIHSRLDLLHLVTREFNSSLEITSVLNRVLTATVASVGASDASLSLFDPDGNLESFIRVTGFQTRQLDPAMVDAIHKHGLVSWVKKRQQAILIDDTSADKRWYTNKDNADVSSSSSAIAVPVQSLEQFLGVLTITASERNYFDDNDLAMLTIIGDQAAFAIANARLFKAEQHRRRLADILASIARTINSTLDLNEVLNLILKHLALVIDYDSSSILLFDDNRENLVVRAARGFDNIEDALSVTLTDLKKTINYQAIIHKTPIVIADVDKEPGWIKSSSSRKVRSWIGAPLITRNKVIGMLTVDSHDVNKYTAENAREVAAFADQAATAVANAQTVTLLQNAEASYTALFENSTDVIIITNYQGKILNANRKVCQILSNQKEGIIGQDIAVINPQLKDYLLEQTEQLKAQEDISIELDVQDTEGQTISLEIHGHQVTFSGIVCVQWTGRDISARRETEKMRQDLVNMLVHDLRGPVGNLINVIEMLPMLVASVNESPAFQNILDMARRSGQEVRDLIDSLLDVGLLEQGEIPLQRNPVIFNEIMEAVEEQIEPRASAKETEVTFHPLPKTPVMWVDGSMIRRVLINLIDNAIKYTPYGGQVSAKTTVSGDTLYVTVSDNGPGIGKSDQAHIFEKFSRVASTSKKASGVGLGLAFCKLAVEAHGGTINVESEGKPGKGSMFLIALPIISEPDESWN